MRLITITLALLVALVGSAGAGQRCGYDFTLLGVPNTGGDVGFTSLLDLNNRGAIIGGFSNSNPPNGYLLNRDSLVETISVPGSLHTVPVSINNRGEIVGFTRVRTGPSIRIVSFLRDSRGDYTIFEVPNALRTEATGISNNGRVVGAYRDSTGTFGFLWDGETFQSIPAPFGTDTALVAINNANDIVGFSIGNPGTVALSFLLSQGEFTQVEVPGKFGTNVTDINDRGQIVGTFAETDPFVEPNSVTRSFVLDKGTLTLIDAPFPGTHSTVVTGINNRGELVGDVLFADFRRVGFVAVPSTCQQGEND